MSATINNTALAERFAHLRTPENERFFQALVSRFAPLTDHPCVELYFTYALTSTERGRQAAALLSKYRSPAGARYLDIGCAYAGFLVGFAERGAEVVGIEIDPHLIALAEHNLRDAGLDIQILRRDATRREDLVEWCHRFDIITCNDVIEHVDDPLAVIQNIALLLRSGGIAYLEIPNRDYVGFVLEDGHFRLFGITLLEYVEAAEYYKLHSPQGNYDMRFYLDLDQYEALFRHAGLDMAVLDETLTYVTVEGVLANLEQVRAEAPTRLLGVPAPVAGRVAAKLESYVRRVEAAPRSTEQERQEFLLRYGASFWKVMARPRGIPAKLAF